MEEELYREILPAFQRFLAEADFGPISPGDSSSLQSSLPLTRPELKFYRRRTLSQLMGLYVMYNQKSCRNILEWDYLIGQFFPTQMFPVSINRFILKNIVNNNSSTNKWLSPEIGVAAITPLQKLDNLEELIIDQSYTTWKYTMGC